MTSISPDSICSENLKSRITQSQLQVTKNTQLRDNSSNGILTESLFALQLAVHTPGQPVKCQHDVRRSDISILCHKITI